MSPGLERLAASLVALGTSQVVQSTLVFAAVALATWAGRLRRPHLRHTLWTLVMLRLLLPPGLHWRFGVVASPVRLPEPVTDLARAAGVVGGRERAGSEAGPRWPLAALALAWAAGSLVTASLLVRRVAAYRAVVRDAAPVEDEAALAIARRWRAALGVRRPVRLVASSRSPSPFTLGVARPVIHLPAERLASGPRAWLESAIAHEMAHVRRLDALRLAVDHVLRAVYFFHPVVWITAGRLAEERERLCDQMVLVQGIIPPASYAESLLRFWSRAGDDAALAPARFRGTRRYAMRIRALFEQDLRPRRLTSYLVAAGLGLACLPGVPGVRASEEDSSALASPLPGGWVTSPYGPRRNPVSGARETHTGVDIGAPVGGAILAPADGVVERAETRYLPAPHLGTVVILDHGQGLKTFYAHIGRLEVKVGQRVRRGETIGKVGSTGISTGPHIHFEVWREGEPVDPAGLIPRLQPAAEEDDALR